MVALLHEEDLKPRKTGLPRGNGVKRLTCIFEGADSCLRKRISSGNQHRHDDFPTFQQRGTYPFFALYSAQCISFPFFGSCCSVFALFTCQPHACRGMLIPITYAAQPCLLRGNFDSWPKIKAQIGLPELLGPLSSITQFLTINQTYTIELTSRRMLEPTFTDVHYPLGGIPSTQTNYPPRKVSVRSTQNTRLHSLLATVASCD